MSFMNVAPGVTATVALPLGPTYERWIFKFGGTTLNKTHLTDIRLRVNGRVIHQCSGADLESPSRAHCL
ncbi:major capsid protein P2 [Silvimonas iriomotensis]|nr:major capsid protein P2 [Silvimonas iriomotensis]